ncbi:hypothetical protein [Pseudoxanthomonas sp. UTMC 1351]|uniref:hypothetical protein n=1 Tax=Pseudoxanthomonas sp. UTMC 1351 TaxID=2695853 RepID=UPI0034D00E08
MENPLPSVALAMSQSKSKPVKERRDGNAPWQRQVDATPRVKRFSIDGVALLKIGFGTYK